MAYLQKATSIEEFDAYYIMKSEPAAVNWSGYAAPPNREKLREHFAHVLENPDIFFFFLQDEESGEKMGYSQLNREGTSMLFASFCLLRKFQNAGLARTLIALSLEKAKEIGVIRMNGWISEKNYASMRGFRSFGMNATGATKSVHMEAFDRDDIYHEYELYF